MPALPDPAGERADETRALLALVLAGGRTRPLRDLLDHFGSASHALAAGPRAWQAAGLDRQQVQALGTAAPAASEQARRWLEHPRHHLLGWGDDDYPPLLRSCQNPPLALFIDGDPACLWQPAIAVVGSRNPSAAGCENAYEFARALSASGLAIGSGLAAGIDAAAHRAALDAGGATFAVIGTGPDLAYPRRHAPLQTLVAARGAVVSEYPPGTPPRNGQFPARNRVLAALCLGTVVVEAAARSGALITARLAAEAGREVFAVPGSIRNAMARGCHRLIRDGAILVTQPADILEGVANLAGELAGALQNRLLTPIPEAPGSACPAPTPPDPDYQRLWNALGHDPTGMDSLIRRTGLTASRLSSMLLVMELEGKVSSAYGCYTRT